MSTFKIRIAGVCCHFRNNDGSIRTILVDAYNHPYFQHFAHLEVQAGGVIDAAGLPRMQVSGQDYYVRDGITYEAYRLNQHRLHVPSLDASLSIQYSFENFVPSLTNVCRTFGNTHIHDFAGDNPSGGVAAQLDITVGELKAAEYCEATHFDPIHNDPPQHPGQDRGLATEVELQLQLDGAPVIEVKPFGENPVQFRLQPWVEQVRLGNLGLYGIKGLPEQDAHHFLLYYDMADTGSACYAIPLDLQGQPGKGLGGGCSNTQYP